MARDIRKDRKAIPRSILGALGLVKTPPYDYLSPWQYFWPKQLRIWTNNGQITADPKHRIWARPPREWAGWAGTTLEWVVGGGLEMI